MGCASSSPFVTSGNGVLTAAKGAATDAVHASEGAINDVKDSLNEKVGVVKDAVIGAVQNVGHGIETAFGNGKKELNDLDAMGNEQIEKLGNTTMTAMNEADYKIISLKDPADKMIDDALDEIDETIDEKMTKTNDILNDTMNNMKDDVNKMLSDYTSSSPMNSIDMDSLKTTSPEPEIENALANDDIILTNPPSPKPTLSEMENLHNDDDHDLNKMKKLDEHPGGIYEQRKLTDSQAALIREGAAVAAIMANE